MFSIIKLGMAVAWAYAARKITGKELMVKLLNQQSAGISFRRFILTVVISAAFDTVIPLEPFQIASAFGQIPTFNASNAWLDGGNGYGVTQNFGTPPDTSQGARST